ncbi:MAG: hypothetical protein AAB650_00635, partial [Patescibacteria group bacterium]
MKRAVWFFVILAPLLAACAGPVSDRELFPQRNTNPTIGLIRNWGTTSLNVWVYDQANRLVEKIYLPPAKAPLPEISVSYVRNERQPVVIAKDYPIGHYRVEYIPFYFIWGVLSGRQRVDLPRGSSSIYVGRDPNQTYDQRTGRHWGWVL